MKRKLRIPHVAWRNGRPRFVPAASLRRQGHRSHDLKNPDGSWMTEGQALDWSHAFAARLRGERRQARNVAEELRAGREAAGFTSYTVADMMKDWLGSVKVLRRAPRTIRDYREKTEVIENYHLWLQRAETDTLRPKERMPDPQDRALARIWTMEAAALSRAIAIEIYEKLYLKRGNTTANQVTTVMGSAFAYAQDRAKVDPDRRNPFHKLGKERPKPKPRFATREEIETLIATADADNRHDVGDLIALGVWLGQRQADRLTLRLDQIKEGRFVVEQSKTEALVAVRISPQLEARLRASAARRRRNQVVSPYVVVDELNWTPFKADWYRKVFAAVRAAAAARMPSIARLRDKDLRATAVIWLAMAGCTNTEIASITGHSLKTVDTILKHYWKANIAQSDAAMAKMIEWYQKQGA